MTLQIFKKNGTVLEYINVMKLKICPAYGEEIAKLRRDDDVWEIHSDNMPLSMIDTPATDTLPKTGTPMHSE
ncbi:hypothetical protein FACS1894110_18410 [Spirochaetia bacterium]|nr:hypothetical protein FACS1894110_18410 [Spirochaetia bacterium]